MSIHFSSLIPKMSMLTLAISCLATFFLPWFMGLTFYVPMQYCSLQLQTLISPPNTSTTEHHFCFGPATSFSLELLIIAFCSFPSSIFDTFRPGVLILWCCTFLPFHTAYGFLQARILEWFSITSSSGPSFVRTLHYDLSILVALPGMAHSFIELCKPLHCNKAVIHDHMWSM